MVKVTKSKVAGRTKSRFKGRPTSRYTRALAYVPNSLTGIPDTLDMKFKYSDIITVAGVTNAKSSYGIYLNGPAIPDSAKSSNQPYYWDELKTLYDGGICYGSKISVKFLCASSGQAVICALRPQLDSTLPTTLARIAERPRTKTGIHVAGQRPLILKMYQSSAVAFGQDKRKVGSDHQFEFSLKDGTNPGHLALWYMLFQDSALGAAVANCVLDFEITYYCRLFQKKRVISS